MAEATTPASKTDEPGLSETIGAKNDAIARAAAKTAGQPPHIALRVLIGLAGLSLLVGFLMPWLNVPGSAEGVVESRHGYHIAMGDVVGAPGLALWALPVLGVALSVAAFMGFRWAGQMAIGVAVAIVGYALYVVLQMFVQHTELGLWIVAGGTFIVLLLGVIAWMVDSRRKVARPDTAKSVPATSVVD